MKDDNKKSIARTISKAINASKAKDLNDSDIKKLNNNISKLASAIEEYNKNYKQFLIIEKRKLILEAKKIKHE